MFHEKLGLMYDADGNVIAFSGSMNETANAFENNYESIDVFTSWMSEADRVKLKETAFDSLWNNRADGLEVSEFNVSQVEDMSDTVPKPIFNVLQNAFENIRYLYNNPGSLCGVPTGLNIAVNAAKSGKTVAVFSLEMSSAQLGNRLLSALAK